MSFGGIAPELPEFGEDRARRRSQNVLFAAEYEYEWGKNEQASRQEVGQPEADVFLCVDLGTAVSICLGGVLVRSGLPCQFVLPANRYSIILSVSDTNGGIPWGNRNASQTDHSIEENLQYTCRNTGRFEMW